VILQTSYSLGWPSGWVEPELGRPTLGLGRVGHTSSVRKGWTGSGSCPTNWTGQALLAERVDRVRVLVRRIESNRSICSSNAQPEFRLIQKARVERSTLGLVIKFCSTDWTEQTTLSDELNWTSNPVRARALG
jgi:hypothetical protein